jgi:transcriptional regulator with XRE-family HTH domain
MKSIEYDKLIVDRQRRSIQAVLQKRKLSVLSWAGSAGISEGAVRNFLSGISSSITTVNAQKLAESAGVPISELLCGLNGNIKPLAGYITNGATYTGRPANQLKKSKACSMEQITRLVRRYFVSAQTSHRLMTALSLCLMERSPRTSTGILANRYW